ncbi:S49 family peptidase [Sphingomonas sp. WKB10]|nr:S49 family peptidase [Sphingomonas sp. WKB10]
MLIVPVVGILAPRGMYGSATPYEGIADCVREGAADKTVTSIILAIRSPGGTVWGCEEAGDAIFAARAVKPVVAVADPCCFSAAYWLAAQAGKFYVTTSGEVGSVGVRSGHTDMSGFENKVGMKTTLIASSADKIAAHPYAPLSDEDRAEIQSGVDAANRRFMLALARGRRMRPIDVPRTPWLRSDVLCSTCNGARRDRRGGNAARRRRTSGIVARTPRSDAPSGCVAGARRHDLSSAGPIRY